MVSVIIPTYNREKVIKKSIESVLNQTYTNIEVIIVDDGSTDNTKAVVNSIKDNRIKYIYQNNQGACVARNRGIAEAQGDYIAFQDSDDEWENDKLEKQLKCFNDDIDFVSCGMEKDTRYKIKSVDLNYDISLENILKYNVMSTQTMIMKRKVCKKVKFDQTFKRLQDWDFLLQVYLAGFKIHYLNEHLVLTHDSQNSITGNVKMESACLHLINKYNEYYKQYPKSLSYVYMNIARSMKKTDRIKTNEYLIKSLKLDFSFFTLIKIVLNKLSLWK